MIRHCTDDDPFTGLNVFDKDKETTHCGETFDDETHSTLCPHDELPPERTLEELEKIAAAHGIKFP